MRLVQARKRRSNLRQRIIGFPFRYCFRDTSSGVKKSIKNCLGKAFRSSRAEGIGGRRRCSPPISPIEEGHNYPKLRRVWSSDRRSKSIPTRDLAECSYVSNQRLTEEPTVFSTELGSVHTLQTYAAFFPAVMHCVDIGHLSPVDQPMPLGQMRRLLCFFN